MTTHDYNKDPIEKLYNVVRDRGDYSKTIHDFKQKYSTPESIDNLYDHVSKSKLYRKTKEDFYKQYFPAVEKKSKVGGASPIVSSGDGPKSESDEMAKYALPVSADQQKYFEEDKRRREALESPKVKLTEEEITSDPVSSYKKVTLSKVKERTIPQSIVSSTAVQKPLEARLGKPVGEVREGISYKDARKDMDKAENYYRQNTDVSLNHLTNLTGIAPEDLYDDANADAIVSKLRPGNETDRIAVEALDNAKTARIITQDGGDFQTQAIRLRASKKPEFAEQMQKLGDPKQHLKPVTLGELEFEYFNDPAIEQEIKRTPQLYSEYKQEKYNLFNRRPEFGRRYFGNILAQKMEDMGINNGVLNVVTQDELEKVSSSLLEEGKISLQDKSFIDREIKPRMGLRNFANAIIGDALVPTTGVVENVAEGVYSGLKGLAVDLPSSLAKDIRTTIGLSEGKTYLAEAIEKQAKQTGVRPSSFIHEMTQFGGNILGQSVSVGYGGRILQGIGAAKNLDNAIRLSGALQAYGMYDDEARRKFDNPLKQIAFKGIMSAMFYKTEGIFNDRKVVESIMRKMKPEVAQTIKEFTSKRISEEAIKYQLSGALAKALREVPGYAKYGGRAIKQNVAEEVAQDISEQSITGVFEGKPINEIIDAERVVNTGRQAMFGSGFIAAIAARSDMKANRGITAKTIYEMAENADQWKEQMTEEAKLDKDLEGELPDKIANLDYAAKVLKDLEGTDMTEKAKIKYLMTSLDNKVREKKAEGITDKTLAKKESEAIKGNEAIQEALLNGKDDGSFEGDKTDEGEDVIELTPQEQEAIDGLQTGDFEGTGIKTWTNIIQNPEASANSKRKALQELYEQLNAKGTEATVGTALGKKADLIYDLNYEKPVESEALRQLTEQPSTPMQDPQEGATEGVVPSTLKEISELNKNRQLDNDDIDSKIKEAKANAPNATKQVTIDNLENQRKEQNDYYESRIKKLEAQQQSTPTKGGVVPSTSPSVIMPGEIQRPETITIKPKEDAIQEQRPDEMDVRQQAGDGETMGERDTQPEITTGKEEGKDTGKEEVGGGRMPPQPPGRRPSVSGEGGDSMRELDRLANNVPDSGRVAEYMSKETIEKYTGETPTNDQRRGIQELQIALDHGEKIIEKAQTIFGSDYVDKTLDYIENSTASISNKALMYVSLENALGREKLLVPERAADITKQQALVYEQSQKFAREYSLALNYQKLRKIAQVGYDIEKVTNNFFSPDELAGRRDIEKAVEADADAVNKEAESQEQQKGGISPETETAIKEGVEKEINKIYQNLPKDKKTAVDKAIAALDKVHEKLRSKTYESTLGIPVAIIDAGVVTIRAALKAGVKVAKAVEMGIDKIKEKYGKEWANEDRFRKDYLEGLKSQGVIDAQQKRQSAKEYRKLESERNRQLKRVGELTEKIKLIEKGERHEVISKEAKPDVPEIEALKAQLAEATKKLNEAESQQKRKTEKEYRDIETERNRQLKRVQELSEKIKTLQSGKRPDVASKVKKVDVPEIESLKAQVKEETKKLNELDAQQKRVEKLEDELGRLRAKLPEGKKEVATKEISDREKILKKIIGEEKKADRNYVKNALIEQGFGREITVKGETKQTLDWKKLAGAAGTVSKISENVGKALERDGFTEAQLENIKDDFIQQYVDLRASVIEKAQNELAKRNKENVSPEQKSAAKRLAELYTYGLFESKSNEFDIALNKALGAKVSEQGFSEAKEIAQALETIYTTTFKGAKLNDVSAKAAIEKLEDRLRVLLFREARTQGNRNLRVATLVRNYFEIQQTMILNNLKQAVENPFSGFEQNVIDKITARSSSTPEMADQRRKLMKDVYKDMILHGGIGYGKVEATFVNRQHIDDYVNKLSDNKLYHGIMSVATGKATLNAMDAMWKAGITEKKFAGNLITVLTHETNPNRMGKDEALKFVSEQLTGQTFKEAQTTAKEIIEKINKDAGKTLVELNKESVDRFASDIVKAALEMGGKIPKEDIEAAYNAAYKAAGLGLGHQANNPLSGMITGYSAKIEGDINQAIRNKEWNRAAFLTYKSVLFRNILNPFVGGGTNWLVLKLEKTGLGLFTGLAYQIGSKSKIDMSTELGRRKMEERLYNHARYKDNYMRGLVGGVASLLTYAAFTGIAGTDEYRKWRAKNQWAARYLDIFTPEMLLTRMAVENDQVKKYVSQSFNKNDAFDASTKAIKMLEYASKGKGNEAWGAFGEMLGGKANLPLPWRLVKDAHVIYQGATGQDPYHGNYKPSTGALNGFFQGGAVEYFGWRPSGSGATSSTTNQIQSKPKGKTADRKPTKSN